MREYIYLSNKMCIIEISRDRKNDKKWKISNYVFIEEGMFQINLNSNNLLFQLYKMGFCDLTKEERTLYELVK